MTLSKRAYLGALVAMLSAPAFAQSTANNDQSDGSQQRSSNRLLEEVVVTARKRTESVQDVPISIAAFSAEKLDAIGIETAQQLDKITPGLVFGSTIGFNTVSLRGVGSDAYLPSADPSVPIYVDDINSLPSQGSIDALVNVERVEVLKGPQGTLFGRNALGGAIRIVTPDPRDDVFEGQLKADYGRYDLVGADSSGGSAFLNIPIAEGLAATLSGLYRDEEPIYTNELGEPVEPNKIEAFRGKVKWYVTDTLDITLSGAYEEAANAGGLSAEGTQPSTACAICTPDPKFDYRTQHNVPAALRTRRTMLSGYVNWDLPTFTAKLILSDQNLDVPYGWGDLDYTSAPIFAGNVGEQYAEQRTAEFRIESNDNSFMSDRLTWVVGAYSLEAAGGYDPLYLRFTTGATDFLGVSPIVESISNLLSGVVPNLNNADVTAVSYGVLNTESISGFAEGNYHILDRLKLTLGVRYDEESRDVSGSRVDLKIADGDDEGDIPFSSFDVPEANTSRTSPRVSLQWEFDNAQVYGSYSVGYLSPTYNTVNILEGPNFVEQEENNAYELGFKGSWLDGQLQLEGALFYTERTNIITAYTSILSGGAVTFFNAGDGEIKGVELSMQLQPMPTLNPGLALIASGSYLDGEYTDYKDGRGYDEDSGLTFGPGALNLLEARDFTGNTLTNTPEFTGSISLLQAISLGRLGEIELGIDTYYNSGYFFSAQNTSLLEQEQYQTYDARISYFYNPWGLQLTLFGENLTDERYFASAVHLDFGPGRSLAPPKQLGVRAKWTF